MRFQIRFAAWMSVLFVGVNFAAGQAPAEEDKPSIPPWRQLCEAGMAKNKILSRAGTPFTRLDEPVLIHAQSIRDDQLGAVYMWVDDAKLPVAIADGVVAPDPERPGTHYFVQEFHSLYRKPIVGQLGSASRRWVPQGPGLTWKVVPGRSNQPRSEQLMIVQTRQLTRGLKAHGIDWRRNNQRQPLRFLSKPLYTYTSVDESKGETTIGCVFVFCLSIDPEIIYCVEARTTSGTTKWYQAFAAFSDMGLFVERDGETIWSESPVQFSSRGPHTAIGEVNLTLPEETK